MDTMDLTKITGALCGSLLVLLLVSWASGAIYGTGESHGEVEAAYVIEVDEVESAVDGAEAVDIAALVGSADLERGRKLFAKCKACHKLENGENGTGPHLFDVVDREIASVAEFNYSGAFQELAGVWGYAELDGFLERPTKYVPGTKMSFAGLKKPADRANLIAYLESIGN